MAKFSEQSHPKLEPCTVFPLYLKQFSFRGSKVWHNLFKNDFFQNWILSESSITQLFCAGFPLLQSNLKLCLTTYDSFSNIFEMQPLLPHLSSCHTSIPSSSPPPLASPLPFLLHRGTKPNRNYCLQVFTQSHILMEPNCWSLDNPKVGLNPQVKKNYLLNHAVT